MAVLLALPTELSNLCSYKRNRMLWKIIPKQPIVGTDYTNLGDMTRLLIQQRHTRFPLSLLLLQVQCTVTSIAAEWGGAAHVKVKIFIAR